MADAKSRIPVSKASASQLRAFAVSVLGLDLAPNVSADKIRAAMLPLYTADTIPDMDMAQSQPQQISRGKDALRASDLSEGFSEIQIHPRNDDRESLDVTVSVNGRNYLMQRGVAIIVPNPVLAVLLNAVRLHYRMNEEGTAIQMPPDKVEAYPFQVLRTDLPDPKAAVAA